MTTRLLERRSERPRIMMTRYAWLQLAVKLCFCTSNLQVEQWFNSFAVLQRKCIVWRGGGVAFDVTRGRNQFFRRVRRVTNDNPVSVL
jgi:hypothetical protein